MEEKKNGKSRVNLKVTANLIIMVLAVLACIFILPRIVVYFMPFIVGWIIALIANPLVRFLENKLKIKRKAGTAFVIILVLALVILVGYAVISKLIKEVADIAEEMPQFIAGIQRDFENIGHRLNGIYSSLPLNLRQTIDTVIEEARGLGSEWLSSRSAPTMDALGNFASNLPLIIVCIVMGILSAFFFVADYGFMSGVMEKVLPASILGRIEMIKRSLKRAVGGYFKAQLKIEIWVYLLLLIGFFILRIPNAALLAILVACLDFLPVFGTGTILIPWCIIQLLNGDYRMAIGLFITWGVGQLVRQLIQPKIVGDSVGLPALPTLFLLYIGYRVGGVVGMIIAVPVGIILWNMYEEGVFDTTIKSVQILYAELSNFRHITEEDMESVRKYKELEKLQLARWEQGRTVSLSGEEKEADDGNP